eukprot:CAMPEP_0176000888 /NCGR_PEP_ID=MMETSP0108-20121206/58059_1 /TAXON_ID=195067 ORGANISM="Goniomonas pacifica, Strain CCMP1869" /NCGR_SAMPLE_ID=MMETSP0108 /ASSEMBLY_ACC=CAM_ASM_000204 /LENGTH=663 /DNA_ID=CAMNT_0017333415 /DNA_START=9 /DNA_END=2000 /DNA_ORIENTATION=-
MAELANYLAGAFGVLERMFENYDRDRAGTISFAQLVQRLAVSGFRDDEVLSKLFTRVDKDKSQTLDFSEFLVLMYLWAEVGSYQQLIVNKRAAEAVKSAFDVMERCYTSYDVDRSRQLSHDEFNAFMTQQLPQLAQQHQVTINEVFPAGMSVLSFSRFLYLLYRLVLPGGKFSIQHQSVGAPAVGQAPLQGQLQQCFANLERDFQMFDQDRSNCIDLAELTQGVTVQRPSSERLDILTRIEYYFRMVDVDRSETIDFFEFMYLAFLITQNGSYRDLVDNASNPAAVKECFMTLRAAYKKYDVDGSNRLTIDEVHAFLQNEFGGVPPSTDSIFAKLQSSPDRPHIDFVRFMHMLYEIASPTGPYVTAQAQKPAAAPTRQEVHAAGSRPRKQLPKVKDINVSEIRKGKVLGQGGQGIVYIAEYRGIPCAAKFLLQGATPELCAETAAECQLMERMDNENVHGLLGCKTQMPDICMLTELCPNGSLFDCYMKKRMRFDKGTQWRFARECAIGIDVLHQMNPIFMHRDIKSLNVFLDENFVCKVADFGMAKDPRDGKPNLQGMGTPQWCAPEVLMGTNYDHRCDVFSYGIMLWEITHHQVPYMETGMNQAQIARAVIKQDLRPRISPQLNPRMGDLIKRCWDRDPARRPSCRQIIQELDAMKGEFCG